MAQQDLSKVFGESGVSAFSDLPKVASEDTQTPAPAPRHEPPVVDPEDFETEANDLLDVDDIVAEASSDGMDDAFSQTSYILPEVIRHVAVVRKKTQKTNADLVMDALDYYAQREQLAKLITRRQAGPGRPKGSLFPSRRVRGRAVSSKSRKLWTFQATQEEEAVMQQLADQYGANSLSELVSVVVENRYKPKD